MENLKEQKEYREERFEFALYVNENLICKRNFRINNYIEESLHSLEMKNTVDKIVHMIDSDLKSKSRVYTWYYFNEKDPLEEFTAPLIEPWECTFKFVITDNKREVISKIWDGFGYPKSVRTNVDIANKSVKIVDRDGNVKIYNKDTFFETNKDRLSPELYVLKAQINDKPDLLLAITRTICETCASKEGEKNNLENFTMRETYGNYEYKRDKEDSRKFVVNKCLKTKKYQYGENVAYRKYVSDWKHAVAAKTKKYFENLF